MTETEVCDVLGQPPSVQTVGLTSTMIPAGLALEEDSVSRHRVMVFASNHGNGVAYWEYTVLQRRIGSDPATGVVVQSFHSNSAAAATWTVTPVFVGSGDVEFTLVGALGVTVDWLCLAEDASAYAMIGAIA